MTTRTLIEGATLWIQDTLTDGLFIEDLWHPRILVTGSRNWVDAGTIEAMIHTLPRDATVIHGACMGADLMASFAAKKWGCAVVSMRADWDKHGKAAGPIRNSAMLALAPDVVWAFHDDLEHSKGTRDTVRKARRLGIPVAVIRSREW